MYSIKNVLCRYIFINTNKNINNTILIAGTGRSGTTWLSEILNYNNEYRDIFEPFIALYTKKCSNFVYKQYIHPNTQNSSFYKCTHEILSGNVCNRWVNRFNKKFICQKRIVKEIRANLFLKWIKINFPNVPILFIIRNPCAVAFSRLKQGWITNLNIFLEQNNLVSDYLEPFKKDIMTCNDKFEKQIYLWCIENYVPLSQFQEDEFLKIRYEDICNNASKVLKTVFAYLNISNDKNIYKKIYKPSNVEFNNDKKINFNYQVNKWKETISKKQMIQAEKIVKSFDLEEYLV